MDKDFNYVADSLIGLIKEVKPSVANVKISLEDSLTETLGLDSLDVLQLLRKVQRVINTEFDQTVWLAHAKAHGATVRSLVSSLRGETLA